MIKVDYLYSVDEKDEIVEYRPNLNTELNDLVLIEGPNSKGKSTLLHIIALGFFGLKNPNIINALKNKMENLLDIENQRIKFYVEIEDKKNRIKLIAKKDNMDTKDIAVYEEVNGLAPSLITSNNFSKNYNLIYDIPDRPTERLMKLNNEIRTQQVFVGRKVKSLREFLEDSITKVLEAKDPNQIAKLRETIGVLSKEIIGLEKDKGDFEVILDMVERICYCRFYVFYDNKLKTSTEDYKKLKKEVNSEKKSKTRVEDAEKLIVEESTKLYSAIKEKLERITDTLKNILKEKENLYSRIWEEIDLKETLLNPDDSDYIVEGATYYQKILMKSLEDKNLDADIDKADLYSSLISILRKYQVIEGIIPGLDSTIPDFIENLEKEYKKYENTQVMVNNKREVLEMLDELLDFRKEFINEYSSRVKEINHRHKNEDSKSGYVEELDISEVNRQGEKLKDIENKKILYKAKLLEKDISINDVRFVLEKLQKNQDFSPYFNFSEESINEVITKTSKDLIECMGKIRSKGKLIESYSIQLKQLEGKKPHKYQDYIKEMNDILTIIQMLEHKILVEFNDYIDDLINEKVSKENLDDLKQGYYEKVSLYLGKRLGTVRHGESEIEIDKIDLLNRRIHAKNGKEIKLDNMGTGQSQASFLKGLLRTEDKRKLIALFDEVAMMDSDSLGVIIKSLKELKKQGKLLAGIIVRMRNDKLVVRNLMDG